MLPQPHLFLLIVMMYNITTNIYFTEMDFQPISKVELPVFNIAHITNYFISRVTCDGKSARDYKSLNSKAFPLFKDGHVQDITACNTGQLMLFRAKCLPEMKKTEVYRVELSQDKMSGDITSALCGCTAGKGPKGSCKHIAALCYALEEFNRMYITQHVHQNYRNGISHEKGHWSLNILRRSSSSSKNMAKIRESKQSQCMIHAHSTFSILLMMNLNSFAQNCNPLASHVGSCM